MGPSYFETLMRHHAWAVERLLDTAALVTPAQLDVDVLSHGSLLATLRHVADVDQSWGRTAQGRPVYDVERAEHGNQIGWQSTSLGHSPGDMGFMGFVDLERRGVL